MVAGLRNKAPQTNDELHAYVWSFFNKFIPRKRMCEGHNAPFEYLANSYFGRHEECVCWANRGGGKTQMGALSTMLDTIHKPDCSTRILGGSLEQSKRMYEHCDSCWKLFRDKLVGDPTQKRTKAINGSDIEIFTASSKSTRGAHVPRLKMDEIDEIDSDVYEGAIFIAQSTPTISASIENFSTMHRVGGQMAKVVDSPESHVYKWCLWETIEKCEGRTCSQCALWGDCQGKAKNAEGYIRVDDALRWLRNSSRLSWEAETLCLRPCPQGIIFSEFDERVNVKPLSYDPELPLYRAIDFGYNFFCCLYIQADEKNVYVIDEYKGEQKSLPINIAAMKAKEKKWTIKQTYIDPAGRQHNDQTGKQSTTILEENGIKCEWITSKRWRNVVNGINLVRNYLAPAVGGTRMYIGDNCTWLRQSFQSYAWKKANEIYTDEPEQNTPWEHPMDSLRYYMVNRHGSADVRFY